MNTTLPPWLQSNCPAYHRPTGTLFIASRLVRCPTTGEYLLMDAPRGCKGNSYRLSECCEPTIKHLYAGLMVVNGKALSVSVDRNLITIADGQRRIGVRIPEQSPETEDLKAIAQNFAQFFNGKIIEEVT
ncbi:hypothetical protein IQ268_08755 [Oculatella sp. LEGE 06141]|uniref:hypothetical protein n=1 Tax=Oculatella sp. LEGE 06141 TaxID=1828648 RepID=UPI0018822BCB|nr:hypothetical protein [Oculatella sp. LEGE 06141]MBE9178648.1 hypothetical protein [Oculatella sp. LEGE 06141]